MIRRLGAFFTRLSNVLMPHPFVFALLLTLVTFILGLVWAGATVPTLLDAWYDGFWNRPLLEFAFQMAMILITGHALANTAPVRRLLDRLHAHVHGTRSAVAVTSLTAMAAALVNWGLGLIVGAILAREIGRGARRRGIHIHYPLVVAAGYTGLLVWHGGLSGSAPLRVATPGHALEPVMGVIPISRTLFSPMNLAVTAFFLMAVPVFLALMAPPRGQEIEARPGDEEAAGPAPEPAGKRTPAVRLEESRLLVWIVVAGGLAFLVPRIWAKGLAAIDLNSMNFTFLLAGLALHGTPRRYAESIDEAVRGAGGILLQFPFYFGIMGMMQGSGLVQHFAMVFVHAARTLGAAGVPAGPAQSILTFLSAAVVNLFVPSGGGQWAVQGPIAVEAAHRLGTNLATTVMALAYGDELTNMLQPFWALPLLALTGLQARQIVGYTALLMLLVVPALIVLMSLLGT